MSKNVRELFDLAGMTAVLTGGSRGIGKEMAEGLGEAGANLVLCARRQEWLDETVKEFAAKGFKVRGVVADVSNPADVKEVINETVSHFERVDILVNNAGTSWGAMP